MKFINKVIVFVMGLVVIGVATTTIGVVTQSKNVEKNVTFEILNNYTYTPNVFDKIVLYSVMDDIDNANIVTNIQLLKVNNIDVTQGAELSLSLDHFTLYLPTDDGSDIFFDDGIVSIEDGVVYPGVVISITFDVEQETPAIIKTLLFLTPLILSASLIGFLAFKKGDE